MSVAAVADPAAAPALGPQAAVARIAELQQLMAQAGCAGDASASNAGTSFSDALAGASAAQPTATAAASYGAPVAGTTGGTGSSPYDGLVTAAAQRYGIDPTLLHGLIQQESGFDPSATSGAGAVGLCQLMPSTAASLGVTDPTDPAQSIDAGARYLKQQLDAFGGDPSLALAAYNAGPGAVQRSGGVPPYRETQDYVQKVLGYANDYRSAQA